jgi:hypothetical protein
MNLLHAGPPVVESCVLMFTLLEAQTEKGPGVLLTSNIVGVGGSGSDTINVGYGPKWGMSVAQLRGRALWDIAESCYAVVLSLWPSKTRLGDSF